MLSFLYPILSILFIIFILGFICLCVYIIQYSPPKRRIIILFLGLLSVVIIAYSLVYMIINTMWSMFTSTLSYYNLFMELLIPNFVSIGALLYALRRILLSLFSH